MTRLPGDGPSIRVQGFELVGNRVISTAVLQSLLDQDRDKDHTLAGLEEIASKLTRFYRSKGYFVARVYVPAQKVSEGVVILRAVEGNYGQFTLDNQSLVRTEVLQAMLDDVRQHNIVSVDTLERAMLIINDTPGSKVVRADVMPGQALGTSDFAVGTVADPRHQGFMLLDNHGTRATGRSRASFNWDWNSPSARGDRLSVSGLASEQQGLLNGRAAYSASLAPNGLRAELALGRTQYEVSPSFFKSPTPPGVKGQAETYELGLSYPLRRIRVQTLEAILTYAHKRMRDVVDSGPEARLVTPKRSDAWTAGLNLRDEGVLAGLDGLTQASLSLTAGRLNIRGEALLTDQAASGPRTQGAFAKLNASLSRVSLLPDQWNLTAALKLQHALGKNLDGTERQAVAGVGAVMAYPSAELSGSHARFARLELARPLPEWKGLVSQWSVFTDWGQAQPTRQDAWRTLRDAGLGWTARQGQGLLIKVYLAHRLDDLPAQSETTPRRKWWVQAGYIF